MDLNTIRHEIDRIDNAILHALQQRIELGRMTLKFKKKILNPEREQAILNSLCERERALLSSEVIESIYQTIFTESRRVQSEARPLIAFQGEHGAYSEVACRTWNHNLIPMPCHTNDDIYTGVRQGVYDFGMVAIENSIAGMFGQLNELIKQKDLHIVGSVRIPVQQCLLVVPGADPQLLRRVYSHSMALKECQSFIQARKLESKEYFDTAGAAKWLAETWEEGTGAIASELAAKYYHLEVAESNIEDTHGSSTRFLAISSKENTLGGNKTSISFTVKNEAGSLARIMDRFANMQINLSHIDSLLLPNGDYMFYADADANILEPDVAQLMEKVRENCLSFRVLGSYDEIPMS